MTKRISLHCYHRNRFATIVTVPIVGKKLVAETIHHFPIYQLDNTSASSRTQHIHSIITLLSQTQSKTINTTYEVFRAPDRTVKQPNYHVPRRLRYPAWLWRPPRYGMNPHQSGQRQRGYNGLMIPVIVRHERVSSGHWYSRLGQRQQQERYMSRQGDRNRDRTKNWWQHLRQPRGRVEPEEVEREYRVLPVSKKSLLTNL